MKNAYKSALVAAGLLALSFASVAPSIAAPTVTGVSGCIMRTGGAAGSGTWFDVCQTWSNGSNSNWISGEFVRPDSVNTAFSQLEKTIIDRINSTTANIGTNISTVTVTETASVNAKTTKKSSGYSGSVVSRAESKVDASGADATNLEKVFKKY